MFYTNKEENVKGQGGLELTKEEVALIHCELKVRMSMSRRVHTCLPDASFGNKENTPSTMYISRNTKVVKTASST